MFRINVLMVAYLIASINCSTPQKAQTNIEIPPPGTLWENDFGYTDVYSVVDEMPKPIGGNVAFLEYVQAELANTPCRRKKKELYMIVLSDNGLVIGVHTNNSSFDECDRISAGLIEKYPFSPGLLEVKPVKTVLSFWIDFKK